MIKNSSNIRFILRNCLEISTIGLPFCAFKIISGLQLDQPWLTLLGAIDLMINLTNFLSICLFKIRILDACFISFLTRRLKTSEFESVWSDLGNSFDVILSFSLVAIMIGGGFIKMLAPNYLMVWNICVILNVIGAGINRLTGSIEKIKFETRL